MSGQKILFKKGANMKRKDKDIDKKDDKRNKTTTKKTFGFFNRQQFYDDLNKKNRMSEEIFKDDEER